VGGEAVLADAGGWGGPVVVVSYACAGVELLAGVLSGCGGLACTSGTGIVPLCQAGLAAWQRVEGRGRAPARASELAVRSVRSVAAEMMTVLLARAGARRWCEIALAGAAAAGAFLEVFPSAVFVCFHRGLDGVAHQALRAYPWGLADSPFWAQGSVHPGDSLTAVAAHWAAAAGPLAQFEAAHPEVCLRVRYEDLAADPGVGGRVLSWLGLQAAGQLPGPAAAAGGPGMAAPVVLEGPAGVAFGRLPTALLARVNEISAELGYGELT